MMPKTASELRSLADECHGLAAVTKDLGIRKQLLEVASQFNLLALHREYVAMMKAERAKDRVF